VIIEDIVNDNHQASPYLFFIGDIFFYRCDERGVPPGRIEEIISPPGDFEVVRHSSRLHS
jgi:hypothetical protein